MPGCLTQENYKIHVRVSFHRIYEKPAWFAKHSSPVGTPSEKSLKRYSICHNCLYFNVTCSADHSLFVCKTHSPSNFAEDSILLSSTFTVPVSIFRYLRYPLLPINDPGFFLTFSFKDSNMAFLSAASFLASLLL